MTRNITNSDIVAMLRALAEKQTAEESQAVLSATANCLPFSRVQTIALNKSAATAEERAHLAACAACASFVKKVAVQSPHPSVWQLIQAQLGKLSEENAAGIAFHMQPTGCSSCRARSETWWLQQLKSWVQGYHLGEEVVQALAVRLAQVAEQAQNTGRRFVGSLESIPTALQMAYGQAGLLYTERNRFDDRQLTVLVQETPMGLLSATVMTPDTTRHGRKVYLTILGLGNTLDVEMTLQADKDRGCRAHHIFGVFCDILGKTRSAGSAEKPSIAIIGDWEMRECGPSGDLGSSD